MTPEEKASAARLYLGGPRGFEHARRRDEANVTACERRVSQAQADLEDAKSRLAETLEYLALAKQSGVGQ